MNGFDVFRASHRLLGADEGFDLQDSAFMSVEIDRLAKTFHFIKTAEPENLAQTVQLSDVGVQIEILEPVTIPCGQFGGNKFGVMRWMGWIPSRADCNRCRLSAEKSQQMSMSCVVMELPCVTVAKPPTSTKSTFAMRRRSMMPVRSATFLIHCLAELFDHGRRLVMPSQALGGGEPQIGADQRDVDAICFRLFMNRCLLFHDSKTPISENTIQTQRGMKRCFFTPYCG
jgi:hypothetical protein